MFDNVLNDEFVQEYYTRKREFDAAKKWLDKHGKEIKEMFTATGIKQETHGNVSVSISERDNRKIIPEQAAELAQKYGYTTWIYEVPANLLNDLESAFSEVGAAGVQIAEMIRNSCLKKFDEEYFTSLVEGGLFTDDEIEGLLDDAPSTISLYVKEVKAA